MPVELLEIIKAGGAAMGPIFAILWWLERSERMDLAAEIKVITRSAITAISETKSAIDSWESVFNPNPPTRRLK